MTNCGGGSAAFLFSLGLRSSSGSSAQRTTWWLEGGTSSRMSWLWRGTSTKVQGSSVQMNHCLLWTDFFVVIAGDVYVHADLHGATSVVIKNHSGQLRNHCTTSPVSIYTSVHYHCSKMFPISTHIRRGYICAWVPTMHILTNQLGWRQAFLSTLFLSLLHATSSEEWAWKQEKRD